MTEPDPPSSRLPLFVTWGGNLSGEIARFLDRWIPDLIQNVDVFFSTEDIRKGQFWFNEIASRLTSSTFGLAVVTREAMAHPWVQFEFGALAMYAGRDRTATLLVDVAHTELPGAMSQVQGTPIDNKDDVLRLLRAINLATTAPLERNRLDRLFERAWPEFQAAVATARTATKSPEPPERPFVERALDEILTLTRKQTRMLADGVDQRMGPRSLMERLRGPGVPLGALRKHLNELLSADPDLVAREMKRCADRVDTEAAIPRVLDGQHRLDALRSLTVEPLAPEVRDASGGSDEMDPKKSHD